MLHLRTWLIVLVVGLAMGCNKQSEPQKQAAEKKETAKADKASITPEPGPKAPVEEPAMAPAEERTPAPEEPTGEGAPGDRPNAEPVQNPAPVEEPGDAPDSACKAKIQAHDERVRKNTLPVLRAEEEAAAKVAKWVQKTYSILDERNAAVTKETFDNFWLEYKECVKGLAQEGEDIARLVGAAEGPGRCTELLTESAQARCRQLMSLQLRHFYLERWEDSEFKASFCNKFEPGGENQDTLTLWQSTVADRAVCRVVAAKTDCKGQLDAAVQAELARDKVVCEAIQAGLAGKECGEPYPADSDACRMLRIAAEADPAASCKKLELTGDLPLPPVVCRRIKEFANADCDALIRDAAVRGGMRPVETCLVVQGRKANKVDCAGLFPADSAACRFYRAHAETIRWYGGGLQDKSPVSEKRIGESIKMPEWKHMKGNHKPDDGKDYNVGAMAEEETSRFIGRYVEFEKQDEKEGEMPLVDHACRRVLWQKKVLPATEGRQEIRLTVSNPFVAPVRCTITIQGKDERSIATRTVELTFKAAGTQVISEFFSLGAQGTFTIEPVCDWTWQPPAEPEGES